MDIFVRLDAWLSATVFSLLMLVAWWLGDRRRLVVARASEGQAIQKGSTRIEDATLALFGLLLAFCFAGAAQRYEARKAVLLDDAMAIGGLATVSSFFEEPERSAQREELKAYVEQRMVFGLTPLGTPKMDGLLRDASASQERMRVLVAAAVAKKAK